MEPLTDMFGTQISAAAIASGLNSFGGFQSIVGFFSCHSGQRPEREKRRSNAIKSILLPVCIWGTSSPKLGRMSQNTHVTGPNAFVCGDAKDAVVATWKWLKQRAETTVPDAHCLSLSQSDQTGISQFGTRSLHHPSAWRHFA
ncbi:MAG: hypothetical protein ACSHXH_10675 [Marivita sp.]|uniref:hypothetical protein n=1 Tax=Marivita sp. TaxID=2003365 RepID=UPI003EF7FA9E